MASTQDPRSAHALHAALQARGLEVDDFAVQEESASGLAQSLGMNDGILKVRCRSTGEERLYSSGFGSAWFGAFLMDLDRGSFARAAQCHPGGRRALQQPAALLGA
jgi:hypothetical protein